MKITSVRLRLLLWNIGVLALVLVGFLVIAHVTVRKSLQWGLDKMLYSGAKRVTAAYARFSGNPDHGPGFARPGSRRDHWNDRPFRTVQLYDLAGNPILPSGEHDARGAAPWAPGYFERALRGEKVLAIVHKENMPLRVLSAPLFHDDKQVGVIQVVASYAEIEAVMKDMTRWLLIWAPCALVIAALGGVFLTNRALQPVRHLTESAEGLNPEDLSQRLPVGGDDEFAHLAATMNGMLARLDDAFGKLKASLERERRFTSDASHELRTPLTAIKANTTLALRGERAPEQYREALRSIDGAADAMNRLVQDLLLLARSDSGQLALEQRTVDVASLLHDAAALVAHTVAQAPVRIEVAPDIGNLHGDPYHLQRLLVNLLENALRHTPPDGQVTLRAERGDAFITLTVTDTGEGIFPEHLPHLGERFYRVDAARSRRHGGVGLGLAICKNIMEAHGGEMTIESTLGEGTRVTILLPAGG